MRIGLIFAFAVLLAAGSGLRAQNVSEQYLLAAANSDRAQANLPPVHLDDHLRLVARLHAYEMVKHGTISHQFAGERDLAERGGEAGAHFSLITENVAEANNSAKIHELWMRSASPSSRTTDSYMQ